MSRIVVFRILTKTFIFVVVPAAYRQKKKLLVQKCDGCGEVTAVGDSPEYEGMVKFIRRQEGEFEVRSLSVIFRNHFHDFQIAFSVIHWVSTHHVCLLLSSFHPADSDGVKYIE